MDPGHDFYLFLSECPEEFKTSKCRKSHLYVAFLTNYYKERRFITIAYRVVINADKRLVQPSIRIHISSDRPEGFGGRIGRVGLVGGLRWGINQIIALDNPFDTFCIYFQL